MTEEELQQLERDCRERGPSALGVIARDALPRLIAAYRESKAEIGKAREDVQRAFFQASLGDDGE